MKTYKHLYAQVHNFENLYHAYRKARRGGKRKHEPRELQPPGPGSGSFPRAKIVEAPRPVVSHQAEAWRGAVSTESYEHCKGLTSVPGWVILRAHQVRFMVSS